MFATTARPPELLGLHRPSARTRSVRIPRHGVLADCTNADLRHLTAMADPVIADSGLTVQAPSRARWVYLLTEGALAVSCEDDTYVVPAGDVVGARAALSGRTPVVGIQTLEPSRLLVLSSATFLSLLRAHPLLAIGVARHLADAPGMA